VSFAAGTNNIVVTPLPTSFDPGIPDAYEYQGQTALYSQNVQCDANGDVLFFLVDGNVYNRDGLLIADNVDGADGQPCESCLFKGLTEAAIIPVPGSCELFYIVTVHIQSTGVAPPSYMRVGVLDVTAVNTWGVYDDQPISVRGKLVTDSDEAWSSLDLLGSDVDFSLVQSGSGTPQTVEAEFLFGARDEYPRIDVVEVLNGDGYLLTWSTANRFRFLLFSANGIDLVLLQNKAIDGDNDWRDTDFSYRGELDSRVVGTSLKVAYSDHEIDGQDVHQVRVKYWEYDIAGLAAPTPSMELVFQPGFLPRMYQVATYPVLDQQFDHDGTPIEWPRAGGLEFSNNGRYIYLAKSTNLVDAFRPDEPRSNLWWIDLEAVPPAPWYEATLMGAPSEADRIVDTQLALVTDRNGENETVVAVGRNTNGAYWLGVMFAPNTPIEDSWASEVVALPDASIRADVPGAVQYRLLNKLIGGNTHLSLLQDEVCCATQVLARDRSCEVPAGAYTWSPGSNYFLNESGPIHIAGVLRLKTGAVVNATGLEFRFGPDAHLVIEPGASLRCAGCTFTSACAERWAGMDVHGTPGQNQGTGFNPQHQGYLELDNCVVANALSGVDLGRSGFGQFGTIAGQPGGVLIARGSRFQNCVNGVRFGPYQNFGATPATPLRNRSRFTLCSFRVDDTYPDALDFRAHADLWRVDGIRFNGCTFENLRNDITESHRLGMGINSLDANYTVRRWCPTEDCGHDAVRSAFTGLDHGIHARTTRKARAFEVEHSDFINNICGVLTEGVVGAQVTYSDFVLGNRPDVGLTGDLEASFNGNHRGIYSVSSYAFDVRDNDLSEDANATNPTEGIVIGYSRGHNDMVFRNSCTGIDAAYVGEGICADPEQKPSVGLQFICNENHGNGYNIWNRKVDDAPQAEHPDHTIRTLQGWEDRPAGNTFDRDMGLPVESDLHSTCDLNVVNYRFWGALTVTDPLDIDATFFPKQLATFLPPNNCDLKYPTDDGEGGGGTDGMIAQLNAEKLAYGNTRYLFDQLVDGGSTDEVVQEITGTWPNEVWSLRSYLLSKSPFLSVEALKAMADDGVLPAAIVTEICVANPDATQADGFLKWLEFDCLHPLPGYMLAQIAASWDVRTYRTTLQEQLGRHHAGMTHYTNELLAHYERDTIHDPTDSLRYTWQQLRTPAARYAEAITYLNDGNYAAASAVVTAIPTEHDLRAPQMLERQRMLDLVDFLAGVAGSGRSEAALTLAEQDQLEALINNAHDRPATWAQNLLCYLYDRCRAWPTGGDGTDWRAPYAMPVRQDEPRDAALTLNPNPAEAWTTARYALPDGERAAELRLVDITGRAIWSKALIGREGQVVMDTRAYSGGSYTLELRAGESLVASVRLMVKN
jgi:hypothetical protein